MYKPESIPKTEQPKIFWNFEILTGHQIPVRKPNLLLINKRKTKKRTCLVDFVDPVYHRVKIKESEKKYKYLDLARELKISCET